MEFIQGEKFTELADDTYVFYRHTHDVDYFFQNEAPDNPFILISHNSDGSVEYTKTRNDSASFSLAPQNLVKWFAQNVKINNPKIHSIPIGLENFQWFPEIKKIEKIYNLKTKKKQIQNLIYLNVNIETNPNERSLIYEISNDLQYITKESGKNVNGFFDNYLDKIFNHHFVISPPGNGEDCHRTWECLYSNSYPIVKKSHNSKFYEDLPICFIEDWNQLKDYHFLINELDRLTSMNFNLQKLDFEYWKKTIMFEKDKLKNELINT